MLIILSVITHTLTFPAAYVSRIHLGTEAATAVCSEIPHPDDDYLEGHLWVNSITGGPDELSPVPQVNFVTPRRTPSRKLEFASEFRGRVGVQTRPLGQAHRASSKMRGRS
jgi:hypothetical protein